MLFRHLYLLLFISVNIFSIDAQNYYAVRNDGAVPKGYFLDKIYDSDKTILLNQPSNQELSQDAIIPFNFYFYNTVCNKYKASDNGYITFLPNASISEIPDTSLPQNSIVAFGRDFKLQKLPAPNEGIGTQVFQYTLGQAPNRRHIIQYYGLSLATDPLDKPINNASIYAFAIVLHEGTEGRFDIIYSPYGDKTKTGAIGCKSQTGSNKTLLNDSLNLLPFQYSFETTNFIVYQFRYAPQPDYDLVIKEFKLAKIYPVNSVVNFSGMMSNWGKKPVHSFYVNYSINQGDTISYYVDQLNLLPNGQGNMNFGHPISWLSGTAGSLNDVNFWLSKPDNDTDGIPENSHFAQTVLRNNNNNIVDRNLLLEEGTGAWCGFCPDAHLIMNEAVKQYGNRVIPVSYHYDDSMTNADGAEFLSRYISSYPDALIDRKLFLGSNSTWMNEIASRLNVSAPVEVKLELKSYNLQSRVVSYRVRVIFKDYWYGNLQIGSIITERTVRGNANANIWSQNNYYSKYHNGGVGGSTHPLYNELEFMDGYLHKHVHRESPGGVWGIAGIIPQLALPNAEYTADFTYTLPPARFVQYSLDNNTEYCSTIDVVGQNEAGNYPANIEIIGYLSEYNDDYFERPIINAVLEPLWNLSDIEENLAKHSNLKLYPNPAADNAMLQMHLDNEQNIKIEVINSNGQIISVIWTNVLFAGDNMVAIDTKDLPAGMYTIKISSDNSSVAKPLLIFR